MINYSDIGVKVKTKTMNKKNPDFWGFQSVTFNSGLKSHMGQLLERSKGCQAKTAKSPGFTMIAE